MSELTVEQELRQQYYFDLLWIKRVQGQYNHLTDSPYGNVLWLHVTDLQDNKRMIDLVVLIRENLLETRDTILYPAQGNWRDYFAPRAYGFTDKALAIMDNPGHWIYKGQV